MPRLTHHQRKLALSQLQAGVSGLRIARDLRISRSTLSRLKNRHKKTGSVDDLPRSGRPRKPESEKKRVRSKKSKMASAEQASQKVVVRPAKQEDCEGIMKLIVELAVFEKMEDQVMIDTSVLERDMFGASPACSCLVACHSSKGSGPEEVVGYALYYPVYSTWEGLSLYLEDLYVTPLHRGTGLGKKLMLSVIKVAHDRDCSRLHLAVLGWNTFAKDMYERMGFIDLTAKEDWHLMRLTRSDIEKRLKDFPLNL